MCSIFFCVCVYMLITGLLHIYLLVLWADYTHMLLLLLHNNPISKGTLIAFETTTIFLVYNNSIFIIKLFIKQSSLLIRLRKLKITHTGKIVEEKIYLKFLLTWNFFYYLNLFTRNAAWIICDSHEVTKSKIKVARFLLSRYLLSAV